LCHLQHKLIGFYNRDEKCLLRGTDWAFKQSGLRLVFKELININFLDIFEKNDQIYFTKILALAAEYFHTDLQMDRHI
jgi:hypothetical protein